DLADIVKNAENGSQVRTAIYESMLETSLTATEAREITEALLDGTFDQGLLDIEIREKLQKLEEDYAPQLTKLGVELAQT
ncbi:hypothetical protein, partial [Pseudomonas sp. 2822-15]|uniref:hypothetical protein n=1 Tax=Pseudomonas sp. 2822-15 TaxID=1712677 RepID=UPI0013040499